MEADAEVFIRNKEGQFPSEVTESKEIRMLFKLYSIAYSAAKKVLTDQTGTLIPHSTLLTPC